MLWHNWIDWMRSIDKLIHWVLSYCWCIQHELLNLDVKLLSSSSLRILSRSCSRKQNWYFFEQRYTKSKLVAKWLKEYVIAIFFNSANAFSVLITKSFNNVYVCDCLLLCFNLFKYFIVLIVHFMINDTFLNFVLCVLHI